MISVSSVVDLSREKPACPELPALSLSKGSKGSIESIRGSTLSGQLDLGDSGWRDLGQMLVAVDEDGFD